MSNLVGTVLKVARCRLQVTAEPWPYAAANKQAIAEHWNRRQAENPDLFNGRIHIMLRHAIAQDELHGEFAVTDFASFLFWREHGYRDTSVRDAFGSAILRSDNGEILLALAAGRTINAGRAYLPGGFIDKDDVRADGAIDIDASIAREVLEETGIGLDELERRPGYWLSFSAPLLSIGIEFVHAADGASLRRRILAHNTQMKLPEIADVLILRDASAAADPTILPYSRQVAERLLGG